MWPLSGRDSSLKLRYLCNCVGMRPSGCDTPAGELDGRQAGATAW